jgi:hypothetical protein
MKSHFFTNLFCLSVFLYYLTKLMQYWNTQIIELKLDISQKSIFPKFMICLPPHKPLDMLKSIEVYFLISYKNNITTRATGYLIPMSNVRCVFYEDHQVSINNIRSGFVWPNAPITFQSECIKCPFSSTGTFDSWMFFVITTLRTVR